MGAPEETPDVGLLTEVGEALHKGLNCGADEAPCPYCRRLVTPVLAAAGRVLAERLRAEADEIDATAQTPHQNSVAVGLRGAADRVTRACGVAAPERSEGTAPRPLDGEPA